MTFFLKLSYFGKKKNQKSSKYNNIIIQKNDCALKLEEIIYIYIYIYIFVILLKQFYLFIFLIGY